MANEIARKLRKAMTRQEVKLWVKLRELRALGHHFRRQSPLVNYIVDFECRPLETGPHPAAARPPSPEEGCHVHTSCRAGGELIPWIIH
jgi:hypothetical protein